MFVDVLFRPGIKFEVVEVSDPGIFVAALLHVARSFLVSNALCTISFHLSMELTVSAWYNGLQKCTMHPDI